MRELYTITINDEMCYIIHKGLELLEKTQNYNIAGKEEMVMYNKEQFRNLANGKIAEVNEVNLVNPIKTIECTRRVKIE